MTTTKRGVDETYVLSGREFTGTREEILLQLDDAQNTLLVGVVWWLGTKQGAW